MDPITLLVFLVVGCVIFIPMWNLLKEAEIFAESHLDKQIMFYDAYREHIAESRAITEKYEKIRMQKLNEDTKEVS